MPSTNLQILEMEEWEMAKKKRRGNGEGSIIELKNGKWKGQITIGKKPDGKPNVISFYAQSQKEAQVKMNEIKYQRDKGTFVQPTKLTVAEWLTTWLNDYAKIRTRQTTWDSYEVQVRKHLIPAIGHLKLTQLQTHQLQKLYKQKREGGRADGKEGGLSVKSVRYIHAVINMALTQAVKERLISINPAEAVDLPKETKRELQTLTIEQVKTFIEEAKQTKHYTLYLLELFTGLRRGEILGLRWQDIDFDNSTVTVVQQVVASSKGITFSEPKTSLGSRTVWIPADVVKQLKQHKKQQAEEKLLAGGIYEDNSLVFCREDGKPFYPDSISDHFKKLIARLKDKGFPEISFHGLRHTFATLSIQQGIPVKVVQEDLGHHDPGFTMKVYTHATQQMKKEATEKRASLFSSCMSHA